jgi:hypothetical protein
VRRDRISEADALPDIVPYLEAPKEDLQFSRYSFDQGRLGNAHKKCQEKAYKMMKNQSDIVIIDNTNISLYEMKPYLLCGIAFGYTVRIIEFDPSAISDRERFRRLAQRIPESIFLFFDGDSDDTRRKYNQDGKWIPIASILGMKNRLSTSLFTSKAGDKIMEEIINFTAYPNFPTFKITSDSFFVPQIFETTMANLDTMIPQIQSYGVPLKTAEDDRANKFYSKYLKYKIKYSNQV